VESELGQGTTISIYFPWIDEAVFVDGPESALAAPAGASNTVLLVEDEDAVREPVSKLLRKAGYTVLEAADGPRALEVCESYNGVIDLVVSDVVMPIMSGKELAAKLLARRPSLKVLFMSGRDDNVVVHHGLLDEDVHMLAKPFTFQDLLRRLVEVLRTV